MTKAKWIMSNLGHRDNIDNLYYAIKEIGRECEILNLEEISNLCYEMNENKECFITRGSIWTNIILKQYNPNWTGNCHCKKDFLCSSYYSYWGEYLTQKNYVFMPFSELLRKHEWLYEILGKDDVLFIRPDSGEKEFTGELVHKNMFNNWRDTVLNIFENSNVKKNIMCVISSPVDVFNEYRLLVVNDKPVAGSSYRIAKHIHHECIDPEKDKEIFEFAEEVIKNKNTDLPPFYVLDIAQDSKGDKSVIEVGCFCCCGLYNMDYRIVAKTVSECVENLFNSSDF